MADNDQYAPSTPLLAGYDESAGWRETHLYRFTRPEDAAALRHLSGMSTTSPWRTPATGRTPGRATPGRRSGPRLRT